MKNAEFFKENKYCLVEEALDDNLRKSVASYLMIKKGTEQNYGDSQVPGTFSKYGDMVIDDLLVKMLPLVEESTGLELFPTYSYFRIYKNGDELKPHKDRESCEVSVSLCIDYNYDDSNGSWPLYIEENGFSMGPGDMIVYRGTELNHSRKRFVSDEDAYHIQVFLHYVDRNGQFSEWQYDKRSF
jgi:hypothetical protein